jgi:hypothetical protein
VYRLRGLIERARRAKSPRERNRILGVVRRPAGGRPGYSRQDLEHIAGLYINMVTLDNGGEPFSYIRRERMDLLWAVASGESATPEFFFTTDCGLPMSPVDAVRNVRNYLGVKSLRSAHDRISEGMKIRAAMGLDTIEIIPRSALAR